MKRLLLLAAVFAMCVTGVAWGDVIVICDYEDAAECHPEVWHFGSGEDGGFTADTPNPSSNYSKSYINVDGSGSYGSDGYPPIDATDMDYVNFYTKYTGTCTEYLVFFTSSGWADETIGDVVDLLSPAGEWGYVSVPISDITANWDDGDTMDWSNFMAIAYEFVGTGDFLIDHVTLSDTSLEGELVEPEPEAALVFISGPHLVTEGQEVTLVGNVVGGEGEPTGCGWTLDEVGLPDPDPIDTLDLGPVSGDDEGVYVYDCMVDDAPAVSEGFELMLVDAVPLAGGLGLGLLAGACALAGAVTVRCKK